MKRKENGRGFPFTVSTADWDWTERSAPSTASTSHNTRRFDFLSHSYRWGYFTPSINVPLASRPHHSLSTEYNSRQFDQPSWTAHPTILPIHYEPPSSGSLLLRAFYQFAGIRTPGNLPLEDRVVLSAQKCAAWRALDYESDFPLAPDPFARLLAGSQYAVMVKRKEALKHKPRIPIRTRYFDNFITSCLKNFSNSSKSTSKQCYPSNSTYWAACGPSPRRAPEI